MDRPIRYRVRDGVALIAMAAPPSNALDGAMRAALGQTIRGFDADPLVRAIVLGAEGAMFSGGIDLRELETGFAAPDPATLTALIEDCAKPVIALLPGRALAAGAELALAAHYRLASEQASIGFPERRLGIVPVAGGTQRLPRLIGVPAALELLLGGRALSAPQAQRLGLLDGVVRGDLFSGGLAFAQNLLMQGQGRRPTRANRSRLADGAAAFAALEQARRRLGPDAPLSDRLLVDCVEAAVTLPFAAGLGFERAMFEECLADTSSRALRHVLLAERRLGEALLTRTPEGPRLSPAALAVADRLRRALARAAAALARANVAPDRVDATAVGWGLPQGPFEGRSAGPCDSGVLRRLVAALMAEGCRAIADGQVRRAADVDAIAVLALGLARRTGGPMFAAEALGLAGLVQDMRAWVSDDRIWAVPLVLDQTLRAGGGFATD